MNRKSTPILWLFMLLFVIGLACSTVLPESPTSTPEPRATSIPPTTAPDPPTPTPLGPAAVFETVNIMDDRSHFEPGPELEYNSNPPSSGPHYPMTLNPGFYNEADVSSIPSPESFIVHNLEHGYVVFWYNCSNLSETECEELKDQIRDVLSIAGEEKVIVFPYNDIEEILVMTSWGMVLRFERFEVVSRILCKWGNWILTKDTGLQSGSPVG
ncbi:MAG: DUF3105 domain-containing protein [Chloroflexi bacterium]|nr:DUF3105 domain-containing protein [Chloroflexota bacterium]